MNIIQVSSYYPPHLGGQENAVQGLATQLAKAGHTTHVFASAKGSQAGVKNEAGVRVHRMRSLVFGHAPIMPWFPIALFFKAKPGAVIHLHIGQAFTPEMVWLVSKLRGLKYIAHLHIDFEPSGPAGILLPLYKRLVLRRVLQSAAAVVTLNQKTRRLVRDGYGYGGTIRIMNNGLDDAFFVMRRPSFAKRPPHTLRLLFVGRLSKQKNVLPLLEAIAATKRRVHLDIIGEGPERETIQMAIKRLRLKNVTLHGRQERGDVLQFYQSCDALVMPSLYEAQPLVLLEAMAARIPIIGTRVIGVEDHIKGVGILTEPTAPGLTTGIKLYDALYNKLPRMVERGYNRAKKCSWQRTLKQYETLYEQTLAH